MASTTLKRTNARRSDTTPSFANAHEWPAWREHLATRTQPQMLPEFHARQHPLLWSARRLAVDADTLELVQVLVRACRNRRSAAAVAELLPMWLRDSAGRMTLEATALECLAWAHALPALARCTEAEPWWELLDRLLAASRETPESHHESPLAWQLMQAELPLTLAWLLPEVAACRGQVAIAQQRLAENLACSSDETLLLSSRNYAAVRARLASCLRSLVIARELPHFSQEEALRQLATPLLSAMRFTCPGGRQAFDGESVADRPTDLFRAAVALVNDPGIDAAAAGGSGRTNTKTVPPSPAWHSEEAALALLRRNWSPDGEMLAVRYGDRQVRCELAVGKQVVWSGHWSVEVRAEGKLLEQRSDWDHVCWVSDDDTDYLELEARFTGGVRVQRQMLLARHDRLLYLADAVLGQTECPLEYRSVLPLLAGVKSLPAAETREIMLAAPRRLRVLPLALPEWRRDPRGGTLEHQDGGLELTQQAVSRRLYAPLLIDLDPRTAGQPLTWRQLTIAEDRRLVPAETAVGYRTQLGRRQWLIYRALGERGNRTLLGSNLVSEFMFARFTPDGEAQPLLEIE